MIHSINIEKKQATYYTYSSQNSKKYCQDSASDFHCFISPIQNFNLYSKITYDSKNKIKAFQREVFQRYY